MRALSSRPFCPCEGRPGKPVVIIRRAQVHGPALPALQGAKGVVFRSTPPGSFSDWHTAPRRQYIITLSGEAEIGLGDGTIHRLGPGDVNMAEDLTGHGHTTRVVGQVPRVTATIHMEG